MSLSLPDLKFWLIVGFTVAVISINSPSYSQTSTSPTTPAPTSGVPNEISNLFPSLTRLANLTEMTTNQWIDLDGRNLFQVTALNDYLPERVSLIENNLEQISNAFFQSKSDQLQVNVVSVNGSPTININGQYLLTVTDLDAKLRGITAFTWAEQLSQILEQALTQAKQERQPEYLLRQGAIACGIFVAILIANWVLIKLRRRIQPAKIATEERSAIASPPHFYQSSEVNHSDTQTNLNKFQAIENRLLLYLQVGLWLAGILVCLALFPYTRPLQVSLLAALEIPIKIVLVILGIYLAIRLSHGFIDRFSASFSTHPFLSPVASERGQLRISTIFSAIKWIVIIGWLISGLIIGLVILGVNVAPLLAGAGLIGVAVSLASQNLIKDTINGFLIVLEDQYGIGDIIDTGTWSGAVEGLNLRITQLRNSEGRLITIPNSQMGAVANLTKSWSQVDFKVPVAYDTDTLAAIKIIESTALEMSQDPKWRWQIIEPPQVLGVDDFSDRGLMVRIYIKTRPLKQFNVAREYRLRLKLAFDRAGILIPVSQQNISVHSNSASNSKS